MRNGNFYRWCKPQLLFSVIFWMGAFLSVPAQRYTFQKIGLEQGIPSARINDFLEDSRGFFWLATEGAGLVRYDGFEFKTMEPGSENLRPIITHLEEDREGNLWMQSENTLLKYNGLEFSFYYLPADAGRVTAITFDNENKVWLGSRHGLYFLGNSDTLQEAERTIRKGINDLAWYQNKLWSATATGLFIADSLVKEGNFTNLKTDGGVLLAQGPALLWSSSGRSYKNGGGSHFCFHEGILLSLKDDSVVMWEGGKRSAVGHDNGLPREDFKGCYLDRSGVVWLYSNQGLTKWPGRAVKLFDGFNGEVLSVLAAGEIFLVGTGNGLQSVGMQQKLQSLTGQAFPYGVILSLEYYNGYYWLGTESGLIRYDGRNFRPVRLDDMPGAVVFALKKTVEGLWVGTGMGVYLYRQGKAVNVSTQQKLPPTSVYAISEGSDGSLWFGTYTEGFFRKVKGEWTVVREMGGMRLDSLRFNTLAAVAADELWLGTLSEGVFHLKKEGVNQVPAASLGFAEVRSMALDGQNHLWIGSNKGIHKIYLTGNDYRAIFLSQTQQLLEDGCTPQALFISGDVLLAGGASGLLAIDLAALRQERARPALAITNVELYFGEVSGLDEYAAGRASFTEIPVKLKLPSDLNFISFTLSGLSGYQPEDLVYRYRISEQQTWTVAGNRREAVYSNLSPGRYKFEAQVARPGEDWGQMMVSYPFRIKPPLWQNWWFIALVLLLLGGITYWYLRDRITRINQRLRLENSLLEMERKALRLQMNPHFIFNALDSISSFIFKKDPKQAVRYLNNFAKLMRLTLESSMEHLHPVETEVSILKNYLELEKLRFQGKLEYSIEVDEEIDFDVGIPPMMIQPHVENAILHGLKPKDGPGHIALRFILEEDLLICEIEDDGIGRKRSKALPKREDHRSMATQINRDRLELLRRARGEQVEIEIIDKKNPTGTKVILRLPAEAI